MSELTMAALGVDRYPTVSPECRRDILATHPKRPLVQSTTAPVAIAFLGDNYVSGLTAGATKG